MVASDSVQVADLWANSLTVVVSNGSRESHSVIRHGTTELFERCRDENEIGLLSIEKAGQELDAPDVSRF